MIYHRSQALPSLSRRSLMASEPCNQYIHILFEDLRYLSNQA